MRKILLAATAILGLASPSYATAIVDTGSNASGTPWSFESWQYFAGEFSIAQDYTINQVAGFFRNESASAGTVTAQLFSDGGNVPGTLLYSQAFTLGAATPFAWYGVSGLSWSVGAGTYWLAFAPDSSISGTWPGGAPFPLDEYGQASGGVWQNVGTNTFDYLDVGIQISGTPGLSSAVPEPATWALMLAGFGVLGYGLRRRQKPVVTFKFA